MDDKSKKTLIVFFVLIFGVLMFIILASDNKQTQIIDNNIVNIEKSVISGYVLGVNQNRGIYTLFINGTPRSINFKSTRNYDLKPSSFDKFVQIGDSIYKQESSMELKIYRDEKIYNFILNSHINKR